MGTGALVAVGLAGLHTVWLAGALSRRRRRSGGAPWAPLWSAPAQDPTDPAPLRGESTALACILVMAVVLRWLHLGADLWIDEVFTLVDFVRRPVVAILTQYPSDNQHLLYSLVARICVLALGESAQALRLPAVAFGLASIWAAWRLARRLLGPRQALLVAGLLCLSYHHVWFSQDARCYTGLLLASLLSTDQLLRWLEAGRLRNGLGFAAATVLGGGMHLTMGIVTLSQGMVLGGLLASRRAAARHWLRAGWPLLLGASATLQLYAFLLPDMVAFFGQPAAGTTTAPVVWKSPLWLVNESLRGLGLGLSLGWAGVAAAALSGAAGLYRALRRWPVPLLLLGLPAVLGSAILLLLGRNLWPRFFFFELGFAALLGIHGVWTLGSLLAARWAPFSGRQLAMALGVGLLALSAATLPRNYHSPKQDFRGALRFVRSVRSPQDTVVAVGLAGRMYHLYYAPEIQECTSLQELEQLRARPGRLWVIYTLGGYLRASQPGLWKVLHSEFEEAASFPGTLGDGWLVVLRERGPAARSRGSWGSGEARPKTPGGVQSER